MADPPKLAFELPNGGKLYYNPEWSFSKIIDFANSQSKEHDLGFDIQKDVGVSIDMRAFLGGDVYEAQAATLKKHYKYAVPVVSYVPKALMQPLGSIKGMRMEKTHKALKEIGIEPDPYMSQMGNMPEVNWVVQNDAGVVHIINEEGFTIGDLAALERPVLTELADITGAVAATHATGGGAAPTAFGMFAKQAATRSGGSGLFGAGMKALVNESFNLFGREDPRTFKEKVKSFIGEATIRGGTQLIGEGVAGAMRAPVKFAATGGKPSMVFGREGKQALDESMKAFDSPGMPSGITSGVLEPFSDTPFHQITQKAYGGGWRMIEGWLAKTPWANSMVGNRLRVMHSGFVNNVGQMIGTDSSTTVRRTGEYIQRVLKGELQPLAERGSVGDTFADGYMDVLKATKGKEFDRYTAQISASQPHVDAINTLRQLMKEASRSPVQSKLRGKTTHIGGYLDDIEEVIQNSGQYPRKGARRSQISDITALKREVAADLANMQQGKSGFLGRVRQVLSEAEEIAFDRAGKGIPEYRGLKSDWHKGKKVFEETISKVTEAKTPEEAWTVVSRWVKAGKSSNLETLLENNVKGLGDDGRQVILRMHLSEVMHGPDMAAAKTPKQMVAAYERAWKPATKDLLLPKGSKERKTLDKFFYLLKHRFPDFEISKNPLFAQAMIAGGGPGLVGAGVSGGTTYGGGGTPFETMKNALIGGLVGFVGGATFMGGLTYGGGKLVTSDIFVNWLGRGLEIGPGAMGGHLVALMERVAVKNDPYLEQAVGEYVTNVLAIMSGIEDEFKSGQVNVAGAMAPPGQTTAIDPSKLGIRGE